MYYILSLIIFAFTFGSLNPRSEHWEKAEWAYFIHQNRIFLLDNLQKCMYLCLMFLLKKIKKLDTNTYLHQENPFTKNLILARASFLCKIQCETPCISN